MNVKLVKLYTVWDELVKLTLLGCRALVINVKLNPVDIKSTVPAPVPNIVLMVNDWKVPSVIGFLT